MNNLRRLECPRCNDVSFDDISSARSHFISCHCMMCGTSVSPRNSRKFKILEDIDSNTSTYKKIKKKITNQDTKSDNLDDYTGGFTPVVARELIESSEDLIDTEGGPFTQQEFLEFKNINEARDKGIFCQSCSQEYKELVEEI